MSVFSSSRRRKRVFASAVITTAALGFSAGQAVAMPDRPPASPAPAVSVPPTDMRSPDAVDAARPPVQDLRSPDAADATRPGEAGRPAVASEPSGSSWDEVGIIGGSVVFAVLVAMAGIAVIRHHRATVRPALH